MNRTFQLMRAWARLHPRRLLVAPRVDVLEGGALRVDGMVCAVCAARTRAALASVSGVESADVDLEAGTARLRLAPGASVDRADLEAMLQRALDGVVVGLGMRCRLERITRALARTLGVRGGG